MIMKMPSIMVSVQVPPVPFPWIWQQKKKSKDYIKGNKMKITDLLKENAIKLHGTYENKDELLRNAVKLMAESGNISDE